MKLNIINMKTAVEFYREELNALVSLRETKFKTEHEIFEQAKEMDEEQKKQLVIFFYIDLKMKNNKLPYGMQYLNKLTKLEEEAEKYYKETFKQQEQ